MSSLSLFKYTIGTIAMKYLFRIVVYIGHFAPSSRVKYARFRAEEGEKGQ